MRTGSFRTILLVTFLTGLFRPVPVQAENSLENSLTITLQTPAYSLSRAGDGMDQLMLEGFGSFAESGEPDLPGKVVSVALPAGADPASLQMEIVRQESRLLPEPFVPGVAPSPASSLEESSSLALPSVWLQDAEFPVQPVRLLGQSTWRGWQLAQFLFTPAQYNPAQKSLKLTSEVEIRLTYRTVSTLAAQGNAPSLEGAEWFENYDQALSWFPRSNASVPAPGYAILTTNAIRAASSQLQAFVAHKQSMGFQVEIVTETVWGAVNGQAPNGAAEKLRAWLQQNYQSHNLAYVLLIGNPDPDDPTLPADKVGDVPMKMMFPFYDDPSVNSPTDTFYADLTGNWDLDGDGRFGEYIGDRGLGGVDFGSEVSVGRLPVYSDSPGWAAVLDRVLRKWIAYETASDFSWRKSALLPMSFSDSRTDGAWLGERLQNDLFSIADFRTDTLYQHKAAGCTSRYPSTENLAGGAAKNRWISTAYGLMIWWAHGSPTGAYIGYTGECEDGAIIESSEASQLNDARPAITFQASCENGLPENNANLGTALLQNGAVGTVSATRTSWYASGTTNLSRYYSDNASLGYFFTQEVAEGRPVGDALFEQKAQAGPGWGEETWMNLTGFNLYGDPSLGLFTSAPIKPAPSDLTAQVEDHQVQLSWADNSLDETGFQVEMMAPGSQVWETVATLPPDSLTYTLENLACAQIYQFRVAALWGASVAQTSSAIQVTTKACGVVLPWVEDFETSPDNWEAVGAWNWSAGPDTGIQNGETDPKFFNSAHSFWAGAASPEVSGPLTGTLTSPVIYLSADFARPVWSFWSWAGTGSPDSLPDARHLQISTAGQSFVTVETLEVEPQEGWVHSIFDLSAYRGQVLRLRYFFDSQDAFQNQPSGWYVDGVSVESLPAAPTNLLAIPNTQGVRLSWQDANPSDTSFVIQRTEAERDDWVEIGQVVGKTWFQDAPLPGQYRYRVQALSGALSSSYSLPVRFNAPRFLFLPAVLYRAS